MQAKYLAESSRYAEAIGLLDDLLVETKSKKKIAQIRGFLGCVLVRAGQDKRAIEELDVAAGSFGPDELSAIRARVLYALAVALTREKTRLAEASDHFAASRHMFKGLNLLDELRDAENESNALSIHLSIHLSEPSLSSLKRRSGSGGSSMQPGAMKVNRRSQEQGSN